VGEREKEIKEHLNLLNVYLLFYVRKVSVKVNVSVNYHEDVKTLAEYKKGVEHKKLLLHL
jgi:hypothetical protein